MHVKGLINILLLSVTAVTGVTAQDAPVPEKEIEESMNVNESQAPVIPSAVGGRFKIMNGKDIIQQVNRSNYTGRGLPYIPPNASPEEKRRINQQFITQQMQDGQPNASNNFKQAKPQDATIEEMLGLLNESHRNRTIQAKSNYKVSPRYYEDLPNYRKAKNEIKDQLSGKKPLSLKDAYYWTEAAYGGVHLNYKEYGDLIEQNKQYILKWLKQENYDIEDPEALHYGIQSFLSDTLYLNVPDPDNVFGGSHVVMHTPFYYDFIDYEAIEDRRNYFITKTLATGSGQCHTLPVTYLLLAEALGIEANLTFIPLHSTVRYRNNDGVALNYEPTVGRFLADQVYLDMQPTMAKGMKNDIFLSDLTKKQIVATVLIDLGVNFILEHWFADEEIVDDCITTADKFFPKEQYVNTSSLWIKKKTLSNRFNALVKERGITDLNEVEEHPDVKAAFVRLQTFLRQAKAIGLEDFPESEYLALMAYHDENGKLQRSKNMDNKTKRDLFIKK